MHHRLLLLVPLAAAIALSGCRLRGGGGTDVADNEERNQVRALQAQLMAAQQHNMELQNRLDAGNQNQGPTLGSTFAGDIPEGFEHTDGGGLALPDDFAFAKGSADLNDAGQKAVASLAQRLNEGENAGKKVVVKGFTDDTPVSRSTTKEKYVDNWGLSAARGAAVVRALEKAGVSSDRLNGAFRGQLDPRAAGKDEAEKSKNRRVEIYLGG